MAQSAPNRQSELRVVSKRPTAVANAWACTQQEAAFISLGQRLSCLVGRDGYRALLERALDIASVDFPALSGVRPALVPTGRLIGLAPVEHKELTGELIDALGATMTVLRMLLVQFLGPELADEILSEAGSDAWLDQPSYPMSVSARLASA